MLYLKNEDFDYQNNAFSKTKNYEVHPLSNVGTTQYFSPRSKVHNYLILKNNNMMETFIDSKTKSENFYSKKTNDFNKEIIYSESQLNTESNVQDKLQDFQKSAEVNKKSINKTNRNEESKNSSRNKKKKDFEAKSYRTFHDIHNQYSKISKGKSIHAKDKFSGFKFDQVPRVNQSIDFILKEKWKLNHAKRYEKDIFNAFATKSVEFNENKPKEWLKNTINQINQSPKIESLPNINQHKKIQLRIDKSLTKFMGDKYSPFNYEVTKEKKNNCSLKDSFKYKK